ncbi:MAG: ABC transporter ATP-binding protein [Erysipelotrichia bacterium]|nr:ABC transporter ATP-binding protein [Erysipelotrichia bacterium]
MSCIRVEKVEHPNQILSYVKLEWKNLLIITISGIIYNVGMTAGPFFEGQLAQRLFDIFNGSKTVADMVSLAAVYLLVILAVQLCRAVKRFFVRRFANDTSRNMRHMLYNSLVNMTPEELQNEGLGSVMTKAVSDVDACVEGIRKFITEVFDTGVVMIAYLALLFGYDWKLALLACITTPIAYLIASLLKKTIAHASSSYKESAGKLNSATMDRVSNAITYRLGGVEKNRDEVYEGNLSDYEKKAVSANIWESSMAPIYNVIVMVGTVFILYFGSRNVLGIGWSSWNIAAFTAFLSCFTKLAVKSSHAAKLFNSVQKAQVSWGRIMPLLKEYQDSDTASKINLDELGNLEFKDVTVKWPNGTEVLNHVSFTAHPGDVIGITGPIACGKSALGKLLIGETNYEGSIRICGHELNTLNGYEKSRLISYLGHEPQLMSDSIRENICLGEHIDPIPYLSQVCLSDEIAEMPQGADTPAGASGVQLSGGQQARTALARTLAHAGKLLVLDDPFSAVDSHTEDQIMEHIREISQDHIILLISHRLRHFPNFPTVLFLDDEAVQVSTHEQLMKTNPDYQDLYSRQTEGGDLDAAH